MQSIDERVIEISDLLPQTLYTIRVTGNVQEGETVFKTQAGVGNCATGTTLTVCW